jgi:CHAT domain-containing protein
VGHVARHTRCSLWAAALALFAALSCRAAPLDDFYRLKAEGKLEAAVEAIRKEIRKPTRTTDPDRHNTNIRQLMLITLGELAQSKGLQPGVDEEARRLYDEGIAKFARGNPEHMATLANGMAIYYSKSYRNGLALPYFQREFDAWIKLGNGMRTTFALDGIARSHWDMGEIEVWQFYLERTLEIAEAYFKLGVQPTDVNEWVAYWTLLADHMDYAAQIGDRVLHEVLWERVEPIEARYWGNGALTRFRASQTFALLGERERARALQAEGSKLWRTYNGRENERLRQLGDLTEVCAAGIVHLALDENAAAVPELEACLRGQGATGVKESDVMFQYKLGLAYERNGSVKAAEVAYNKAIAAVEGMRNSFSVAERARLFRTSSRLPYWGHVRVRAKAAAQGEEGAFFEALHTTELVRGRQLGELLAAEEVARVSPASVRQLQSRLPADAVVLAYTLTDAEVIVLAMTAERTIASVAPYDARRYANLARSIARSLADRRSRPEELEVSLVEFSRPLLNPVKTLLAGKKRIVALPDGPMNLIPFDVLSSADNAYRALIDDYTIAVSPSLTFIEYADKRRSAGAARNLIALGDPRYQQPQTLAGMNPTELQAARGSGYLSYFAPLPETRTEAESIAAMFDDEQVALLVGEAATESKIKALDMKQFGHLHFATHGILGGEVPGVGEPALVLGNESGEDGFLTSSEVGRFKLDAELTVLSACNTGRGEFVTGEGVMGMSRAFLAAGSRGVVVSLWPVASRQTELLMVDFYRKLRTGLPAAEALRAAKREMAARARETGGPESHPFYWAPFILFGG